MKSTSNLRQFKPSTYCDNVSEPLVERIKELEEELKVLKQQVQTLKSEKVLKQRQRTDERMSLPCIDDKVVNL